jgi:hypothetical protein
MRKVILVLAVGLVSWAAIAAPPAPQAADTAIPKEGITSSLSAVGGTVKVMQVGKDRLQLTYEVTGVSISDTGEGILHNASMRCLGGFHAVNGAFDDESGSCVFTRPDGDQVFATTKSTGKLGVGAKGTYTIVGGTGRMAGISGGGETTRISVRPAADGTTQSYSRSKGKYKLP